MRAGEGGHKDVCAMRNRSRKCSSTVLELWERQWIIMSTHFVVFWSSVMPSAYLKNQVNSAACDHTALA